MDRPTLVRKLFELQERHHISDKQLLMMIVSSGNLDTLKDIILIMLMEDSNEQ